MSDTPRTDAADAMWDKSNSVVEAFNEAIDLSRQLERDLSATHSQMHLLINAAKQNVFPKERHSMTDHKWTADPYVEDLKRELAAANAKIKALVEAGDAMAKDFSHFWADRNSIRDWPKAKEGSK